MSYHDNRGKHQYLWDFYKSRFVIQDEVFNPEGEMLRTISLIYEIYLDYNARITWSRLMENLPINSTSFIVPYDIDPEVQRFFNIEEQVFYESLGHEVDPDDEDEDDDDIDRDPSRLHLTEIITNQNFGLMIINDELINRVADKTILYINEKYRIIYKELPKSDMEHYIGGNTYYIDSDILENKKWSENESYFYDINDVSSSGEINRAFSKKILAFIANGKMKSENPFTRKKWFYKDTLRKIPNKMLKRKSFNLIHRVQPFNDLDTHLRMESYLISRIKPKKKRIQLE